MLSLLNHFKTKNMLSLLDYFKTKEDWKDYITDVMRYCYYKELVENHKINDDRAYEYAQAVIGNGFRIESMWQYGMSYIIETNLKPNYKLNEFYTKHPGMDVATDVLYDLYQKYGKDFQKAQLYVKNQTEVYEIEHALDSKNGSGNT